jgi:MFS superfamily sulfate permease-like transporter
MSEEAEKRVRFDRHELAGAFGDIGTDLPLIVGLIATCKLDAASVCTVFGAQQIATGLLYGLPMPVQPLKAMAALMLATHYSNGIATHYSAGTLAGGGLVIGVGMLFLAATGLLGWLAELIPRPVIRGVQLGLGLSLAQLALRDYVSADGQRGYLLAAASFVLLLLLRRQRRVPAPLVVVGLGVVYALLFKIPGGALAHAAGLRLPTPVIPTRPELLDGALLLALPQLPLSLGNSVIATSRTVTDLFPNRAVSVRRIGFTYGVMNLLGTPLGGLPVCHGCGGLAGFYGFGARTGGAPVIYGLLLLVLGLFLAPGFSVVIQVFPLPLLGVVLLFESLGLMTLLQDISDDRPSLWLALLVAAAVIGIPSAGYLVGMVGGTLLWWASRRGWLSLSSAG